MQENEIPWICAIARGAAGAILRVGRHYQGKQAEWPCFRQCVACGESSVEPRLRWTLVGAAEGVLLRTGADLQREAGKRNAASNWQRRSHARRSSSGAHHDRLRVRVSVAAGAGVSDDVQAARAIRTVGADHDFRRAARRQRLVDDDPQIEGRPRRPGKTSRTRRPRRPCSARLAFRSLRPNRALRALRSRQSGGARLAFSPFPSGCPNRTL